MDFIDLSDDRDIVKNNIPKIKLNEQQEEGMKRIISFLDSDKTSFTLAGYGGTGKTTLIKFVIEYIRNNKYMNIVLCSPTHQANKVIKNSLEFNQEVKTFASIFSKRYNAVSRRHEFSLSDDSKLPIDSLLVIDECSMIDAESFEVAVTVALERSVKIIFMGDMMQLPPIGSHSISLAFTETDEKYLLTQLMRQQNTNPIVEMYSEIRNNPLDSVKFKTTVNEETEEGIFLTKYEGFREIIKANFISDEFKTNKKYCRILCYTNIKVEEYNSLVRSVLLDNVEPQYQVGELLKGYDQISQTNKIENGQDYLILESTDSVDLISMVDVKDLAYDTTYLKYKRKTNNVRIVGKRLSLIEILDNTDLSDIEELKKSYKKFSIFIPSLVEENKQFFKNLSDISQMQGKVKDRKIKTELYKDLSSIFSVIQLDDTIFLYNNDYVCLKVLKKTRPEMFKMDEFGYCEYDDLLAKHKAFLLKKNIDYGYASSIHKIQGTTLVNVMVDLKDIYNPVTDKVVFKEEKKFTTERNTLLYVALSRAKKMTYCLC